MARSTTIINTPQALAIMFEVHQSSKEFNNKSAELVNRFHREQKALVDEHNKMLDENLERLRRELGLPQMIEPEINATYLEQHKIAFVEHGIREEMASARDLLEKIFTQPSEH